GFYAGIIGDLVFIIEWYIEINSDKRFLSFEIVLAEICWHLLLLKWFVSKIRIGNLNKWRNSQKPCATLLIKSQDSFILLFADQLREIMNGSYKLAHIAHFIIIPAYGTDQLGISNRLHPGLSSIK